MWRARRGGPRTLYITTDANLDCAFVENALFVAPKIGRARALLAPLMTPPGIIELVTIPDMTVTDRTDQHWWTGELCNRRGLFPASYVTPYRT